MRKIILLFFVSLYSFSQNIHEIDLKFIENNNKLPNSSYFNIYLSSKNCYKYIAEVDNMLSFIEKNKVDLEINLITDNIVLARKETEKYPFKINYYVDKLIFDKYPQSFYYYKNKELIIKEGSEIIAELRKEVSKPLPDSELVKFKDIKIQDSRFSDGNLFISGVIRGKIIIYDKVLDLGGVITAESNSLDYYDIAYSSKKIYNLPKMKIINQELVNYEDFIRINEEPLRSIKVSVISIYDNIVYTQFEVSQVFKDLEVANKLNIHSFAYLAVKEMRDDDDISTIFDLDTYDSYLYTNDLEFEGENYRLGVSNYYPFIERKNKYEFVSHIYTGSKYIGEATLELERDFKDVKIINIKNQESANYRISPYLKINGDRYFVDKKLEDELSSSGVISFIKGTNSDG